MERLGLADLGRHLAGDGVGHELGGEVVVVEHQGRHLAVLVRPLRVQHGGAAARPRSPSDLPSSGIVLSQNTRWSVPSFEASSLFASPRAFSWGAIDTQFFQKAGEDGALGIAVEQLAPLRVRHHVLDGVVVLGVVAVDAVEDVAVGLVPEHALQLLDGVVVDGLGAVAALFEPEQVAGEVGVGDLDVAAAEHAQHVPRRLGREAVDGGAGLIVAQARLAGCARRACRRRRAGWPCSCACISSAAAPRASPLCRCTSSTSLSWRLWYSAMLSNLLFASMNDMSWPWSRLASGVLPLTRIWSPRRCQCSGLVCGSVLGLSRLSQSLRTFLSKLGSGRRRRCASWRRRDGRTSAPASGPACSATAARTERRA
jgi:hypothetical protein